jgi:hypothetical protein
LVRDKGAQADTCEEYERARGLSLGVCQQINRAEGMRAGWAVLQHGAARLRLQHGMAMCHHVSRGMRELVLRALRPAYGGCGLSQEQHEQ